MAMFFWSIFIVFLLIITIYTAKRFESQSGSVLRAALFGGLLVLGGLILFGIYRYSSSLPEELEITASTPTERRIKIARSPNITPGYAETLSRDQDANVRYELAANQSLSEEILERLLDDPVPTVRKRLSRNITVPLDMIEDHISEEKDPEVRKAFEEALRLRKERELRSNSGQVDSDPRLRITEALEKLPADSEDARKITHAINGGSFMSPIDILASDANADVRYAAASSTRASAPVLTRLLGDSDPGVQLMATITLSRKETATTDTLETFSLHSNAYVREAVALNANTPVYILEQLSKDPVEAVLMAVAGNRNTPPHVLDALAQHKNVDIQRRIARHANASESALELLATSKDTEARRRVALNPHTPGLALDRLTTDAETPVRIAVALNAVTSPPLLLVLAGDEQVSVRTAAAGNPLTPTEVVKQLAEDKAPQVRLAAQHNLRNFAETLRNLGSDSDVFIRRQVAQNPKTPPETLEHLAKDTDVYVRERVALNPHTPRLSLDALSRDKEEQVRLAVRENPSYRPNP